MTRWGKLLHDQPGLIDQVVRLSGAVLARHGFPGGRHLGAGPDDVAQHVLLTFGLKYEAGLFDKPDRALLERIARDIVVDMIRKRRAGTTGDWLLEEVAVRDDPGGAAEEAEEWEAEERLLAELPGRLDDRDRRVFEYLVNHPGASDDEACAALKLSRATLHRAKASIKIRVAAAQDVRQQQQLFASKMAFFERHPDFGEAERILDGLPPVWRGGARVRMAQVAMDGAVRGTPHSGRWPPGEIGWFCDHHLERALGESHSPFSEGWVRAHRGLWGVTKAESMGGGRVRPGVADEYVEGVRLMLADGFHHYFFELSVEQWMRSLDPRVRRLARQVTEGLRRAYRDAGCEQGLGWCDGRVTHLG